MKKGWISLLAVVIVTGFLLKTRINYSEFGYGHPLKVTTWDAFGYYMYLPATIIYDDFNELNWLDSIENKYNLTGGHLYQAHIQENGNYVFKYFGGVAILQLPFFVVAHNIALHSHYNADGFSPPYQWAIALGNIIYALLGLLVLRVSLLEFFKDKEVAMTLVILVLGTNLIQYIAVDSAQSHGYIFPLYCLIIFITIQWHKKPSFIYAILGGMIIGLATIARPTELIMILIPALWNTQTKELAKKKWDLVKANKWQMYSAMFAGFVALTPQLIYWKLSSGSWVYDVGSKWTFLNPWFRVLFGFEKGWFIYTPLVILFIVGLFFIKKYPFRKSVLWFGLINIYIVISWFDWRYGGSYSTRALTQSYPVYALPLAAFLAYSAEKKWKWALYPIILYLIGVNLFQIQQYNNGVLHFDHMNRAYYSEIYLVDDPEPISYSLMDHEDFISDESVYQVQEIYHLDSSIVFSTEWNKPTELITLPISNQSKSDWLKVTIDASISEGFGNSFFTFISDDKQNPINSKIRVFRPRAVAGEINQYATYIRIQASSQPAKLSIQIGNVEHCKGIIQNINIQLLSP